MMVSGSVDAFSDSDKASLQAKVATTAGVDKSLVVISVAAASACARHRHHSLLHHCDPRLPPPRPLR